MKYVTLNNGVKMPVLGYGVYQIEDLKECERCVLDAIEVGYRSIDTAQTYGNEEAVGRAIRKCNVPREELFITTKVWISNAGYEKAKISIEESFKKLQLKYLDLVLIHEPFNDYYGTYRAMEEMYKSGKIRAIGVSNFYPDRLIDLIKFNEVVPAINQVETHPFNQQVEAKEIMDKYGVQIESWAPFAEGRNNIFTNETLKKVGDKYNKSTAQVALRYLIQRGIIVIPKSVHKERMIQNFNIFDFKLDEDDMNKIFKLDKAESAFFSHCDPDVVEIFAGLDQ
ncbi:aldo/keto reductase family protein [Clostridium argentinense CDC 2741]|uniref:Aldo/keto reductase family protein n=1 Tax=Clostridium argentinense CDC 2741 TaxID=1418104 RepID=A0A0C1QZX9_9CLOT|nr:aldo/keto reductase [Clostridium argentinense]ARC86526.1 2,5-diketo-D-gluconic acid reductase [Clostridium argentinense]KIE46672.1 aldo/keto reductase family protein [Clostridium argentinense CDC 2741]NFF37991.1 aldo/keto reductase [Clostridium argentinense]NFP49973.1 aldo/keto reductase [Clostridium argentinense]NFP71383.1 aldo/keto reductase [Clostridium argentinense]